MSKQPPQEPNKLDLILCSNCGATLGWYTQVGERIWVQTGQLKLYSAHGVCVRCGEEWHWASTDKQMEAILARAGQGKE